MKDTNIFGNTPVNNNDNSNDKNKNFCIFNNNQNQKSPIKIDPSLFKPYAEHSGEKNQKMNRSNSIDLKDRSNSNSIDLKEDSILNNEFEHKNEIKKKNFLKQSLNINMMSNNSIMNDIIINNNGNNNNHNSNNRNYNISNNSNNNNMIKNNSNNGNNIINNSNNFNFINNNKNNINNFNNNIQNSEINFNNNNNNRINFNNNFNLSNNIVEIKNIDNNEIYNNFNKDIKKKESHSKDDFSKNMKQSLNPGHEIKKGKNSLYRSVHIEQNKKINQKKREEQLKKKKEEEFSKAQIKDVLNCYICQSKLINPRMCKACKKLACQKCLENWLKQKNICGFCRAKTKFEDTVSIPFVNDMVQFFIDKVEKDQNSIYNASSLIKSNDNEEDISEDNKDIENGNKCTEHNKVYEYYCVQCNKDYCSSCLSILNKSSAIHKNHTFLSLKEKKDKSVSKIIEEYKQLTATKEKIEDLIGLCNLKKKELEIERIQKESNLEAIKKILDDNLYGQLREFKESQNLLKSKEEDINKAVETTPFALKNLINSNDHGQASKIYEHLINVNKFDKDKYSNFSMKFDGLFIDSYSSEKLEFILPNDGLYKDNYEIYNKELNDFITDNKVKIILRYNHNDINFYIEIDSGLRKKEENIKYFGFILIQNKKYDSEFLILEERSENYKHILYTQFQSIHLASFKDENKKIRFKLNIIRNIIK